MTSFIFNFLRWSSIVFFLLGFSLYGAHTDHYPEPMRPLIEDLERKLGKNSQCNPEDEALASDMPLQAISLLQEGLKTLPEVDMFAHVDPSAPRATVGFCAVLKDVETPENEAIRAIEREVFFIELQKRLAQHPYDLNLCFERLWGAIELRSIVVNCAPALWQSAAQAILAGMMDIFNSGIAEESLDQARSIVCAHWKSQAPSSLRAKAIEHLEAITLDQLGADLQSLWQEDPTIFYACGHLEAHHQALIRSEEAQQILHELYMGTLYAPSSSNDKIFAYWPAETDTRPINHSFLEDQGIHQLFFENYARLNVGSSTVNADDVSICVRFGTGKANLRADQSGLDVLASEAFIAGGLGQHSFEEALELLGLSPDALSLKVTDDALLLCGNAPLAKHTELMSLLYAFVADPGFSESAFEDFFARSLPRLYKEQKTFEGASNDLYARFSHRLDPHFGLPEEQVMRALTHQALIDWLEHPLKKSALEVSCVGNFDNETLGALISNFAGTFGTLAQREHRPLVQTHGHGLDLPEELQRYERFLYNTKKDRSAKQTFFYQLDPSDQNTRGALSIFFPTNDWWNIIQFRATRILRSIIKNRLDKSLNIACHKGQLCDAQCTVDSQASMVFEGLGSIIIACQGKAQELKVLKTLITSLTRELNQSTHTHWSDFYKILDENLNQFNALFSSRPQHIHLAQIEVEKMAQQAIGLVNTAGLDTHGLIQTLDSARKIYRDALWQYSDSIQKCADEESMHYTTALADAQKMLIHKAWEALNPERATTEEVSIAAGKELRFVEELSHTAGYWMDLLEGSQFNTQKSAFARRMLKDYTEITPDQINNLIEIYLRPENAIGYFLVPEENPEL